MKNNFYKQNINALRNHQNFFKNNIFENTIKFDNIIIESAKNKSKIFYINYFNNSLYFNSRINPEKEAELYIKKLYNHDCSFIFLIGMGFGYEIKELLNVINEKQKIIIVELDKEIFYSALNNINLYQVFSDKRVFFHLYENDYLYCEFIENILENTNIFLSSKNILTLILPQYIQIYNSMIKNIVKCTNDTIKHIKAIRNTLINFSDKWLINYLNNIKYLQESIDIENFFDKFKKMPAYIVSAGPSLNKNIQELKKINGNGIIFAAYTALKVLLDNNIKPDFVVAIDGRQLNYENKEQLKTNLDIPLIYSPFVDYRLINKHTGIKIKCVVSYDNCSKYFNEKLKKPYKNIYSAGTVAATMVDIAYKMKCEPIIFVGQDLAFTNNKVHAIGTNYDNLKGYEDKFMKKQNFTIIKDIFGKDIKTNNIFLQYKKGIEDYIYLKKDKCKFIDATEGGAYIKGTSIKNLSKVISSYKIAENNINIDNIIKNIYNSSKLNLNLDISVIFLEIKESFSMLQEIVYLLQDILDEFEDISQKENYYDYKNLFLNKINIYNNKIYEFSEKIELFQLTILGKIYESEKDLLKLEKHNSEYDYLFILNSINFYIKIINLYNKIEVHIKNIK